MANHLIAKEYNQTMNISNWMVQYINPDQAIVCYMSLEDISI